MPTFNFSFKISTSSRSDIEIIVEPTTVNVKEMKFKNGATIDNAAFASYVKHTIEQSLESFIETIK